MALTNFKKFKEDFYGKITDLSIFDCMEFNLFKVVLEGLKVDYASRGKVETRLFERGGILINRLKYYKFRFTQKKTVQNINDFFLKHQSANHEFLVLDNGRFMLDAKNNAVSAYFQNVTQFLTENKISYLFATENIKNKNISYDFNFSDYFHYASLLPENAEELELLKNLREKYTYLAKLNLFSPNELINIKAAFSKFFYEYKSWNLFFTKINVKKALFVCHYHKEGFLLACKRHGIKRYELQHGLIAPEDIFYVMPKIVESVREKALFSDKIFTYGNFWKERLQKGYEFSANQIISIGYTMYVGTDLSEEQRATLHSKANGKKVILVTTQTFMHAYFIDYIHFLSQNLIERNMDYTIFVKLHPAEKVELYESLQKLPNVSLINMNLDALFPFVDMNISIYSTTLYDSLRHNVPSFAIWVDEFSEYVQSILDSGVAQRVEMTENPVDKLLIKNELANTNQTQFYTEPNYHLLLN